MTGVKNGVVDENSNGLLRFWHPVAWSKEVTVEKPFATQLLDVPLVVWRPKDGEVSCFYDRCIHRGTQLSMGWVTDSQLVCPYHGWHYAADGACTWIPSLPEGCSISRKARATYYRASEKYGMVWVCLSEKSDEKIPDFPQEYTDPSYTHRFTSDDVWNCNAARFIENMMDNSHFPWVHTDILGTREKPVIQPFEITQRKGGFEFECVEPIGTMVDAKMTTIRHYYLTLPYLLAFKTWQPHRPETSMIWYVCQPLTSDKTRFFQHIYRNYEITEPMDQYRAKIKTINDQDRRIVESQRPAELPLDLREEFHLKGPDQAGLLYRKALQSLNVRAD